MSNEDISKLSSMFEKYRRYADTSCTTLSSVIHESDILDYCDCVPIVNIDMSWLFHLVDGMIDITDDPKRVDLTSLEIGLMIIEVLLYIRSYTEIEELSDVDVYDMFKDEINKSMDQYYLNYKYVDRFNITGLTYIISMMHTGLSTHDYITVVGWVNNKTKILSVIEGL